MIDGKRAGIVSPKAKSYASIATIDAPDDHTVILHLKQPDNFLLTNLSTGAIGIVPQGSGSGFMAASDRQPGLSGFKSASRLIKTSFSIATQPVGR